MRTYSIDYLARKYALVFIKVFIDQLSPADIDAIERACRFISDHRRSLFLLKLPFIDAATKHNAIDAIISCFSLGRPVAQLIELLVRHKRVSLLPDVLRRIGVLYRDKKNAHLFQVSSAHELSPDEREMVEAFLARQVQGSSSCRYVVDNSLIAGIRVLGDQLFFEDSVKRKLRDMHNTLIR